MSEVGLRRLLYATPPSRRQSPTPHAPSSIALAACPLTSLPALPPQVVDAFLVSQGSASGGAFFLGGQYSIAEVLTTSLLQRALVYLPAYRGVDVWSLVREHKLERLEAWMTAALERPSGGWAGWLGWAG